VDTVLPVDGVIKVDANGIDIHANDKKEVEPHAEIRQRKINHQEF